MERRDEPMSISDYRIGPLDWVLGLLTLPLLLFVIQFATTGSDRLLETPRSRLHIYLVLLAVEATGIALLAWLVVR